MTTEGVCPVMGGTLKHTAAGAPSNQDWWQNPLNLKMLRPNSPASDPRGGKFNHAEEFKTLDLDALKMDIEAVMTTSQDWRPPTTATTGRSSFAWPGTRPVPTAFTTVAAVREPACSALRGSTVGPTTETSTRPAGSSARSR